MVLLTRSEMLNDSRWWRVGALTIPLSLIVMGLGYCGLQLASGKMQLVLLLDGFLTITVGGLLIGGPINWSWGIAIGLLIWLMIWNLPFVNGLGDPGAAAVSSFGVAFFGGMVPFGILAYPDLNSFAGIFFVPATIAFFLGPYIAFRIYCSPETKGA
ncbi:hypothetical protein [Sulfitobacter sp.]|uniref:hypothetical protein n=1 Tax=Sulfitobacter sp. TaxID=1903071 RepID=UPI0030031A2A